MEYLPTYTPSKAEIANPRLYARNVRQQMATALNLPIVDQRLEDGKHGRGFQGDHQHPERRGPRRGDQWRNQEQQRG